MHWDTAGALLVFSLVHLAVMVNRLSQVCDLFSRLVGPVCIGQSVVFSRQYYRTLNWYWNITLDIMLYRNQPPGRNQQLQGQPAAMQHSNTTDWQRNLGHYSHSLTQPMQCGDSFILSLTTSFTIKAREYQRYLCNSLFCYTQVNLSQLITRYLHTRLIDK